MPLDRKFSIVVTLGTVENCTDVVAFVRRLKSLSAPGALMVVMTVNEDSALYAAARALHAIGVTLPFNRLYSRHHVHHFTKQSLARMLSRKKGLHWKKPSCTIPHWKRSIFPYRVWLPKVC